MPDLTISIAAPLVLAGLLVRQLTGLNPPLDPIRAFSGVCLATTWHA